MATHMKHYSSNPRLLFDDLVSVAECRGLLTNDSGAVQRYIRDGEPLPAHLKPGYTIMSLPQSARDTLAKLTSDEIAKRGGMRY